MGVPSRVFAGIGVACVVFLGCSSDNSATDRGTGRTSVSGAPSASGSGTGTGGSSSSSSNTPGSGSGGGSAAGGGTAGTGVTGKALPMTSPGSIEGQACGTTDTTRKCCGYGTQTCNRSGEFGSWGPCMSSATVELNCDAKGCGVGEFGPTCDAGVDSGSPCGPGEFGPGCDAGMDGGPPLPPPPTLCMDPTVSNEPGILIGYEPAMGQAVGENGQIKVWVTDERPPIIAPGEQVDMTTGMITAPGDRTAKAADNYLWEPALYIAPDSAETGGTPHFPVTVKGWYNNMPPTNGQFNFLTPTNGVQVPGMDAPPGSPQLLQYSTEYIWDVASLGLKPGTYIAEFVIHDGDRDRAVGCVTIIITNNGAI